MTSQNINCDAFNDLLPDYLGGTLADSSVADAELHLAACVSCRALVDDLKRISAEAAALGPIAPTRDLWPGIAERIQPVVTPLTAAPSARRPWTRRPWIASAVAAGIAVIAAISLWKAPISGEAGADTAAQQVARSVQPADSGTASQAAVESATVVSQDRQAAVPVSATTPPLDAATAYGNEISRLRTIFDEQSELLDPRTQAILSNSLKTIDSAIAEARAALANDPASQFLSQQLSRSLEKKLGVLRMAVLLPST